MNCRSFAVVIALAASISRFAEGQSVGAAGKASDAEPPRPTVTVDDLKGMIRSVLPVPKVTASPGTPTQKAPQTCPCCGQPVANPKQAPTPGNTDGSAAEVVVVSLHGEFEQSGLCDSISPMSIDLLLSLAEERTPAAIILESTARAEW